MTTPRLIPLQSIKDPRVVVYHRCHGYATGVVHYVYSEALAYWWAAADGRGWAVLMRGAPWELREMFTACVVVALGETPADQARRYQDERAEAPDEG